MSGRTPPPEPGRRSPSTLTARGETLPTSTNRIERWGLLAGVTGCVANGLLIALWTVAIPGDARYEWTGPANDVVGAVSFAAMVPVAWALLDHLGRPPSLVAATRVAAAGMVLTVALSALLIVGAIPFPVQGAGVAACLLAIFGWLLGAARLARSSRRLPTRLARAAEGIAIAYLVALPLAGVAVLLPGESVAQLVTGAAAVALGGGAYLALPVWLLRLASRIRRFGTAEGPSST